MKPIASILVALSIPLFFGAGLAQDLAKAKQEGRIVFYTSWGPSDADYVVKAFEKKYAPLKVETVRASSERTLTRLLSEHRANTFLGDVVAVSGIQSGILKRERLARPLSISGSREFSRRLARLGWIRRRPAPNDLCHRLQLSAGFTPTPSREATKTCCSLAGKANSAGTPKSFICSAR